MTVYFTMVHAPHSVQRVGNAYSTREKAREWVPFIRGAWRGCRVSVRSCEIRRGADGKVDERTRKRLSVEFDLEVHDHAR